MGGRRVSPGGGLIECGQRCDECLGIFPGCRLSRPNYCSCQIWDEVFWGGGRGEGVITRILRCAIRPCVVVNPRIPLCLFGAVVCVAEIVLD